MIYGVIVCKT